MIQPFYFAADMICSQCSVYKIITARSVVMNSPLTEMGIFSTEINESGLRGHGADARSVVVRTADARYARRHTKRAAACVTWLSRRRRRRSLHDLQYGLRGQICEHDSERKPRRVVFHGRKRGVRRIDRTPNL